MEKGKRRREVEKGGDKMWRKGEKGGGERGREKGGGEEDKEKGGGEGGR